VCFEAVTRDFASLLVPPLTESLTAVETRDFSRRYYRQKWLGNLIYVQMRERRPMLATIDRLLFSDEDNTHGVHVMYRMLEYYSAIMNERRRLNREAKPRRSKDGKAVRNVQSDDIEQFSREKPREDHASQELVEQLAELVNFQCGCANPRSSFTDADLGEGTHQLLFFCKTCGYVEQFQQDLESLKAQRRGRSK
jgi:hypothetical protein